MQTLSVQASNELASKSSSRGSARLHAESRLRPRAMAARESPDWAEADGEGEEQVRGYLGPFPVKQGTLTAAMKEDIYDQTGCSVNVRGRQQWEHRCLTIVGPPSRLVTAKKLAETAIASTVRSADGSVSKTAARAEKGLGKGPVPAPKTAGPPKATPPPATKVKTETEPQEAAPGPKAATKTEPAEPKQAAQPKAAAKAEPAEPKQAAPQPKAAAKAEPAEPKEAAPRPKAAAKAQPKPCPKTGPKPPPPQAAWQRPPPAAASSWEMEVVPELQYQLNVALLRISTLEQSMLQVQQIQGLQGTGLAALQGSAHAHEDRLRRLEARSRSPKGPRTLL